MRTQFQTLLKFIKETDPNAALSHYKTTSLYADDGTLSPIKDKYTVADPDDIPDSVTSMGDIFWRSPQFQRRVRMDTDSSAT